MNMAKLSRKFKLSLFRSRFVTLACSCFGLSRLLTVPILLVQSQPPGLGDPHARNLGRGAAGNDPLGAHARQSGAHKLDHLRSREAARQHDRFGAPVGAGGEQLERPPAIGLGCVVTRGGMGRPPCSAVGRL
jgi:hypothetical protein